MIKKKWIGHHLQYFGWLRQLLEKLQIETPVDAITY